ncbi:E3 ubiquitin-protein ligase RNF8 isoform X6 [Mustela erminea]|uniref:E3 ubiquitin-protein ligase RNF8 isoform X6 n=1 Tax=Mustela erminea TaxID=36723 RepID=UPI001387099C|nr:E3 ubiquitin-protein ligase RNF8 isoform X6 [Mustela erminea]
MEEPGSLVTGDRAGGRSWCLRRVGMNAEWLLLEDGNEVTIGRGFGVTYQLVSKICPLMISRNHCVLKQNVEGQWTIMDNKSLNGVWLNRERLEPLKVYSIHKGDHIQLGVPLENKENAEYEYEVTEEDRERMYPCLAPKNDQMTGKNRGLRTKRKFSLDELEGPGAEGPSNLKSKISKVSCELGQPVKSHGKGEVASQPAEYLDPKLTSVEPSEKTTEAHVYPGSAKVIELHHKKQKASNPSVSQSSLELFKVTMSRILKLKTQMQEKQGLEKEQGEEDLKQQLAQALQEHRALMEELNRSKKDFEAIIQAKNKELEQTKEEKEKVQAQKEEVLSHVNDVLENELQCIICSEYFIEAVTLNCAHSFCSYCINEWMKRKVECPICRKDIKSKTHSLVLDNCINKMVDNLSSEVKERRIVLIRERKGNRMATWCQSNVRTATNSGSVPLRCGKCLLRGAMTQDPDLTQSAFQLECAGAGHEEHARTFFSEPTDWVSSHVRKCHRWLHAALEREGRAPCPKFTSGSPHTELQLQKKSHQTPPLLPPEDTEGASLPFW